MAKKTTLEKAPFDKNGNMLSYAGSRGHSIGDPVWRDNKPFYAELAFKDISVGRSAVKGVFRDSAGHRYEMFRSDLTDSIPQMDHGLLVGKFRIRKHGANYGVFLLDTSPLEHLACQAE